MKHFPAWLAFILLPVATVPAQTGTESESTPLHPAKPLEGQLAGGQSRQYHFALEAGQYAVIAVDQRSVRIIVAVSGPDGSELFQVQNAWAGGRVNAELIGDAAGVYGVRITPASPTALAGRYGITLGGSEAATDRHRSRIAAARACEQALTLWSRNSRESILEGIGLFEHALQHWRAARDPAAEATTLYRIGLAFADIGEQAKAHTYVAQALPIAQASRDRNVGAWALDAVGAVHNNFGDRRKAVEYFEQALPMMREARDRPGEAEILNNLGTAHVLMGDRHKALTYFEQSAEVFRELQDQRRLATLAGNIGMTYGDLGEYPRALDQYEQALVIQREMANRFGEALTLNNMGTAYSSLADYQKALDAYNAALDIHRSLNRPWNVAINLHNIAWVNANLGNPKRALDLYQEAVEILRTVKDPSSLANTLSNIGNMQAELGNYRKALDFHNEALTLRRAARDRDGEAVSLQNIGKTLAKLNDPEKARDHVEQAIAIFRSTSNRRALAIALRSLGSVQREVGDLPKALEYLNEALQISRTIHDRRSEVDALGDLARVERDRGNFAGAHQRADEALAGMESLRLLVLSPSLRASFFAAARDVQELDIAALMRLEAKRPNEGFAAAALLASERGRARTLLEMLGESGAEIRRGVDSALIDRESELQRLIAAKAERQTRLLSGKHTETDSAAAAKELDTFTVELDRVQSRIRENSPQYAALMRPAPLQLEEIQSKVLDQETVLLEYALGTERSFLWAVTRSSMDVYELPPRAQIEAAARQIYGLLTARNQKPAKETPAARAARVRRADEAYFAAATEASRMLLGPAATRIQKKRLLIVGEGVLQYLPFGALPQPGTNTPLMLNHEVVTAPSASVVAVLRQETAGRKPAEKALAVLADPVFHADDARVGPPKQTGVRSGSEPAPEFARLRFSRSEAEAIARMAPTAATFRALDFDASRDTALRPEMGQYRIVHFATHGLIDSQHPELSGVVLSLVDPAGRPQNGFLRLYDIYSLRLRSDLVVLSACQTALGGEIGGEGLIGLTRGFLYAGAARVVASVWEVDDRTTAELMKRFYEAMLVRNERPPAALRAAQIDLWKTKGWAAPYYWAAFTIQGEWR